MEMKRVLEELNAYYQTTRQAGHTTLMKRGTSNYEQRKLVLVHNMSYGRDLNIPKDEIVTLNSLDRLRGHDLPLVIDNGTLPVNRLSERSSSVRPVRSTRDSGTSVSFIP